MDNRQEKRMQSYRADPDKVNAAMRKKMTGETGAFGYGEPDEPVVIARGKIRLQRYTARRDGQERITYGDGYLLMVDDDPDRAVVVGDEIDENGNLILSIRAANQLGIPVSGIPRRSRLLTPPR